ncbi:hypothetical protein Tco_0373708 [Tanacetum coccineum]
MWLSITKPPNSSSKHNPSHTHEVISSYTTVPPSKATTTATLVLADRSLSIFFKPQMQMMWILIPEDLIKIDALDLDRKGYKIAEYAMTAKRFKKFYKKTCIRPRRWKKCNVAFEREKSECSIATNTGHFAREYMFKGSKEVQARKQIEQTTDEELNHALMAFHYEKLKKYRRIGMKAVKDKDALQKIVDSWFASSKNLWKLIDCGMSSTVKIGLGYGIQSNAEVLGYEEEIISIFCFCKGR